MDPVTTLSLATASGPHCPNCHAAWFRTVSSLNDDFRNWIRQCKLCHTRYSVNDAVVFTGAVIGEANYKIGYLRAGSSKSHAYFASTFEEAERLIGAVLADPKERLTLFESFVGNLTEEQTIKIRDYFGVEGWEPPFPQISKLEVTEE